LYISKKMFFAKERRILCVLIILAFSACCYALCKGINLYFSYKQKNVEISQFTNDHKPKNDNGVKHSSDEIKVTKKTDLIKIASGGSIFSLLQGLGIETKQARCINDLCYNAMKKKFIKSGQEIEVVYEESSDRTNPRFISLSFSPTFDQKIVATANGDDISVENCPISLVKQVKLFSGSVSGSFFKSAKQVGIASEAVAVAVNALSYSVNFQHGIRPDATFEVLAEVYLNSEGKVAKFGSLLYVALNSGSTKHVIYSLQDSVTGKTSYYNQNGESVVKSLLQTPIEPRLMRVSSKFSKSGRMHPILGYSRAHLGVDFAANYNTPVMSAGDGVVVRACYDSGYGNCVRIRHKGGYETVYAHLNKFGRGIRAGSTVSQKQVIGYVGSTGLATGPHLHHEVLFNGHHMDPQKVVSLPKIKLSGSDLGKFVSHKKKVDILLQKLKT
jgi:murein DD-endopeptidase MepM/ murein hydrolase activator NlpD